jgi:hypothetical protein
MMSRKAELKDTENKSKIRSAKDKSKPAWLAVREDWMR